MSNQASLTRFILPALAVLTLPTAAAAQSQIAGPQMSETVQASSTAEVEAAMVEASKLRGLSFRGQIDASELASLDNVLADYGPQLTTENDLLFGGTAGLVAPSVERSPYRTAPSTGGGTASTIAVERQNTGGLRGDFDVVQTRRSITARF